MAPRAHDRPWPARWRSRGRVGVESRAGAPVRCGRWRIIGDRRSPGHGPVVSGVGGRGSPVSAGPQSLHLAPGVQMADELADHLRIELGVDVLRQLLDCLGMGHGGAVGAVGGHRVVGIAGQDDPAADRDLLTADPVGIAAPVPALVLVAWRMSSGIATLPMSCRSAAAPRRRPPAGPSPGRAPPRWPSRQPTPSARRCTGRAPEGQRRGPRPRHAAPRSRGPVRPQRRRPPDPAARPWTR